jgi:methylated-DNA-[protein]-cysteine S-methyltransferase
MSRDALHFHVFETEAGHCGVAWRGSAILRFQLPSRSAETARGAILRRLPDAVEDDPAGPVQTLIDRARAYFSGEAIDFTDVPVDLGRQDAFFAAVYAHVRALHWGETTTYGAVAKALGAGPEAARAVGQAMATNPLPLIIPCHRVLAAGNKVGGFSAPGGSDSKRRMLELEGVTLAPPKPVQQEMLF